MKTIVTLVGDSDVTREVIDQTGKFARALNAQVFLIHIISSDPMALVTEPMSQIPSEEERQALISRDYKHLSSLANLLSKKRVKVRIQQLVDADIGKALAECERCKADLIIVGSHHHGALYNWFVGSVTGDVIKAAPCPVLVVPMPIREKSSSRPDSTRRTTRRRTKPATVRRSVSRSKPLVRNLMTNDGR